MSRLFRSPTLTERKPPPTGVVIGPLSATPLPRIDSSASAGSGLPSLAAIDSSPAERRSHSKSTPVASSTRRLASVSSGPVPSPGMRVTRCVIGGRSYTRRRRGPDGKQRRQGQPHAPRAADSHPAPVGGRFDTVRRVSDFRPGLEGVVAFETEIAEPDKEGGALRYRGVDIEDLIGTVSFGNVWALLVDGKFGPGLPPAEPFPVPVHSGDIRVDVQSAVAMLAPYWGLGQLLDISDEQAREDLARVSVTALSFVAQSARGLGQPAVPQREVDKARTITERFMIRWRGEPDPQHVEAVDAYWVSAAEHGMNAS